MLCHTYRIYYAVPYIQDILCCAMYYGLGVTLSEVFKMLKATPNMLHLGTFLKDYKSYTQCIELGDIFKRLQKLHTVCCTQGHF